MSTVLMADGKALMCDKCDKYPARYYVSGASYIGLYDGICANCCRAYLLSIGDTIGANKFKELI